MKKGSRVREDEVLPDWDRALLFYYFLHNRFLRRFSGGCLCSEECLCASGRVSISLFCGCVRVSE